MQTTNGNGHKRPLVLITGVSGLVGTRLADRLASQYQVVGLDLAEPEQAEHDIEWIRTDLTEEQGVRQALEQVWSRFGEKLDSVIHLAAYYDFSGEPSPLYEELTVQGTRRLLECLQSFQVGQFVFSSSLLVMQPDPDHLLNESSPTRAQWDYPESKLKAEAVIRETRGEIPAVIVRFAGVYDEDCHSLPLSQQIRRIYERQLESHVYPGNRDRGQALVHLDDLIDCFHGIVERRSQLPPEELFLIAEPDVMSYGELQDRLGELIHGESWTTIRVPKPVAKAGAWVQDKLSGDDSKPFIKPWMVDLADDHYAVDITHARQVLGWNPQHRLRNTLPEIIARLKTDPEAWYAKNGLEFPESLREKQPAAAD
ncbi:MAG: NAD(P)-dependent oxidoreductase [Planctomycetes bacterium]|nr:NAD(P)-dependent oxidoreductase [Planctomycetota bacterium]